MDIASWRLGYIRWWVLGLDVVAARVVVCGSGTAPTAAAGSEEKGDGCSAGTSRHGWNFADDGGAVSQVLVRGSFEDGGWLHVVGPDFTSHKYRQHGRSALEKKVGCSPPSKSVTCILCIGSTLLFVS
jgi:hypothetical protein